MNKRYWDALKRPPVSALKKITGGRLNGKTDINPQWRIEAMTETFGPIGIGWGYTIEKLWTEPASDEVTAFAIVSVWYMDGDTKSAPIHGIGGSMLAAMEKSGLHANDECYKMAVTDALSVALKSIGVAADIYAGLWDGTKYLDRTTGGREAPDIGEARAKTLAMLEASGLSDTIVSDFKSQLAEAESIASIRSLYTNIQKQAKEAEVVY